MNGFATYHHHTSPPSRPEHLQQVVTAKGLRHTPAVLDAR